MEKDLYVPDIDHASARRRKNSLETSAHWLPVISEWLANSRIARKRVGEMTRKTSVDVFQCGLACRPDDIRLEILGARVSFACPAAR